MTPSHRSLYLFLFFTILLGGCGSSSSEDSAPSPSSPNPEETTQFIGPIPESEFLTVAPPTFEQLITAFDKILAENPTLKDNETDLARAVFDEIKTVQATTTTTKGLFDLADRLTTKEWGVVMTNPYDTFVSIKFVDLAGNGAAESFSCAEEDGLEDTKADAVRHAYWNALMTKNTNKEFAEKFSTAHESESSKEDSKAMALHNNQFGRTVVEKYPEATDKKILEILLQQKFVYIENLTTVPVGTDGLVYIKAPSPFDVAMSGYLTNPDSGGSWDAAFDFSQCGEVIRGQFRITRGNQSMSRRFTGTIPDEATMTLTVDTPYQIENPGGGDYCRNMEIVIAGNNSALSGYWASSNCPLGGSINIAKQ